MRLSQTLKSVRFTRWSAVTRLLGGTALLSVALFVANCGQDQVAGPDGPTRLVFSVDPSAAIAGAPIGPAVRVEARNAENKLSSGYTGAVTVALGTNAGGGTLSGTLTVNAAGGVATFDDLSINKSGDGYTLSASASGLSAATSAPFDISAGPASKLVYSVEPSGATAGSAMALEIEAWDAFDNLDTDFTGDVAVAITDGTGASGATLSGTTPVAAVAGVAAFADLNIDKSGTGYTLDATSGSLTAATSASFDVSAGTAAQLVFGTEPSNASAGAPISPAIQVRAQDAMGNTATDYTGDVSVTIETNPGSGTLSGTATVAAVAGVATFNDLSIDKVGSGYTLSASGAGLSAITSAAFDVTTGLVSQLVFTVPPSNATAGQPITPAVEVTARDAFGNTVASFVDDVTMLINGGPAPVGAGASAAEPGLSGTVTVAAVGGVATFSDLRIEMAGSGYVLEATSGILTSPPSQVFTVDPDAASQLGFSVQPSNAMAGTAISVEVTARDALGNVATGFTGDVTMGITPGTGTAGATLSGSTTQAATAGVATFSDLSIDLAGTGYTLTASSGSLTDGTSAAFDIAPSQVAQLVFTVQPTSTEAGQLIAPAVQVTALDGMSNTVTSFNSNVTMTIGTDPGPGGTLSGTVIVAAVNGVATFSDLSIAQAANGYQLRATSGTLTSPLSDAFAITPGPAAQLGFTVHPGNTEAGVTITPAVVVTATDGFGNTATSFTADVTVAITAGTGTAGAVLSGATVQTAAAGVATFNDLSIDKDGIGYTLSATASGLSGGTSATFDVFAGGATQLVFTVDPSSATAGQTIAPAVQVTALDDQGNTATGFAGMVTLAITAGTGTAGATLSGTVTVAAAAGIATFNDLSIDLAGTGYTLTATSGTLNSSSAAFDINAGPATQLAFTVQPTDHTAGQPIGPAVVVTAQDVFGNTATSFTGDVTLAITSGTGTAGATLSGTLTQAALAGVATFNDLSIDRSGTGYTLDATGAGLPVATSGAFAIDPDAAVELVFSVEPSSAIAAMAISPAVQVTARDQFGNTASAFTGDVSVAIGANPGSGTLSGTLTKAAVAGTATFGDLSIDMEGSGYTLTADATGLTGATSAGFDITPDVFSQLAFTVQPPASNEAGAAFVVEVAAQDASGNTVANFTGDVTVTLGANPPGGTLAGGTTVAAVGGVATFTDLSIAKAGAGYQLQATAATIVSPLSTALEITPAAASQLVFTTEPTTRTAGLAIDPAVEVTALDQFGNTAVGFASDVIVAIAANPGSGTLSGTLTVTAAGGIASFNDLSIDKSGIGYTLSADASGLGGATSATFDINASAATKLTFTADPVTTTAGLTITPAVEVTALDDFDNVATSFTGDIEMAIDNNPGGGTLSGTLTVTAAGGIASFGDLSIDRSGTGYTLTATSGTLTLATSAAFDINTAAASKLVVTVQPSDTEAGNGSVGGVIAPAVEVSALDDFDNLVTGFTGDVTVAITDGTGSAGATLFGTLTQTAVDGVATFDDLSIDLASPTPAGTNPYTLTATSGILADGTSVGFEITAGAAAQLVFTVQPTDATAGNGTVGGTISPAVAVTAQDALGNTAASFANAVTLSFASDPSGGTATLFGETVTAANGIATFPDLAVDVMGNGYTLQATDGALTSAASSAFNITAGAAIQLAFIVPPSSATTGATIVPPVEVAGQDALGNTDTGFSASVQISKASGPGSLSGTLNQTAFNGVATFNNLSLDQVGTYELRARSSGLTQTVSAPFNIIASEPTELVFVTQPSTAVAGDGITVLNYISPAVQVVARDASGQTITSFADDITLTISEGPAGATLRLAGATPVTVTPVGGVATFNDLSIDRSRTDNRLKAEITSGGFIGITGESRKFDITPGPADHLAFIGQPSTANVNTAITPQVEVEVQDALDNAVTTFIGDVSMSIGNDPSGAATLSGTTLRAVTDGVATFADLSIDLSGMGYTLIATALGPTAATSAAFDIAPGTANKLLFIQQPTDAVAGVAIAPPVRVGAFDASNNPLPGFAGDVTIAITAGTGPPEGVLSGTTTVTAVNGVATFSDLSLDKKGTYRLSATATGLSGVTSSTVAISPAPATRLDFRTQPMTTPAGDPIPAFDVRARDQFGNIATGFTGDIMIAISVNPSGGTLSGTTTLTAVDGVVTFSDLSIDKVGTPYRLEATSLGLTPDESAVFGITAGAADYLVFSVQPSTTDAGASISPAVRVTAFDAFDNLAAGFVGDVTLAITSGTGTPGAVLEGTTTVAAFNGEAIFTSVHINTAGTAYTLDASAVGVTTGATSTAFDINPAPASQLQFTVQPSNTAAATTIVPPVQVTALNQFGEVDPDYTGMVTVRIGVNPGSPLPGTLFGTLSRAAVAGVATFDNLLINNAGNGYTLIAEAVGLMTDESAAFNITP